MISHGIGLAQSVRKEAGTQLSLPAVAEPITLSMLLLGVLVILAQYHAFRLQTHFSVRRVGNPPIRGIPTGNAGDDAAAGLLAICCESGY